MKTFAAVFLLVGITFQCSVVGDFEFPTVQEQINYAGVIFHGTVVSVSDPYNQATVVFKDVDFYRGCSEDEFISVANFRGDSLCGAGIPKVGDRIIVFACENTDGEDLFKVNQFEPFTGWVKSQQDFLQQVKDLTYNQMAKCNNVRKTEKCYNRKSAGWQSQRTLLVAEEPVVRLIEPVYVEPEYYIPAPEPIPTQSMPRPYRQPLKVQIMPRPPLGVHQQDYQDRRTKAPIY